MLPSSKRYLTQAGLSPQAAAYAVIGCFLGGVISIQVVSRVMHHYIPSHVVDCQHSHNDPGENARDKHDHHDHSQLNEIASETNGHINEHINEYSPLLPRTQRKFSPIGLNRSMSAAGGMKQKQDRQDRVNPLDQRPSLQTRVSKLVSGAKSGCRDDGRCYGYSDPCALECCRAIMRNPRQANAHSQPSTASQPNLLRTVTAPSSRITQASGNGRNQEDYFGSSSTAPIPTDPQTAIPSHSREHSNDFHGELLSQALDLESNGKHTASPVKSPPANDHHEQHHHHVPTNAFLSIGLQTSIAIALHKLPEGFITFATNHANPQLGFAVFMALFIHNITEGFAMALPLYLAIGSRWKSMLWSSLLGGASQPFGAGVAALWFKVAGTSDRAPGETVYGCMFAITAGIMASVALQLFAESLTLNHNRNVCLTFAFIGMGILGVSFALTAG
ncbi:MAG: hypothetical protein L6R41_001036 [Letrouitia leprolyta]|nr:MAG: hypothetical protein L6R41_001036 [Letrouitia leprolyta]